MKRAGFVKRSSFATVSISNFDIAVLGETGEKIVNVDAGSINILELLARTSGTNDAANIKEVMVIRTTGDTRRAYSINLKSKDLFDSPAFYLQQNDVVYVTPNEVRAGQSTINENYFKSGSFWISVGSIAITVTNLIITILRK